MGEKIPGLAPICAENIERSSRGEGEIFKKFPVQGERLPRLVSWELEKSIQARLYRFSGYLLDCMVLNAV